MLYHYAIVMTIQLEILESIPYFSGLNPNELYSISRLIFEKTVEQGEIILLEGEFTEALFFVASGTVKVFKTSAEGKEQILSIVRPRESFNDVLVFDDSPNLTSAQAMTHVVLYGLEKNRLKDTLQNHPQIALNIIKVLAERVHQLMSLIEDLSFKHVIGRVAKILLEHAGDGTTPGLRLTQQEMAAMAGTVREVVARSLKSLEEEGMISLNRHRIMINDQEALKVTAASP